MFQPPNNGMMNGANPFTMIQKFNEFRQNLTGDPRQIVQQLLNSGRMSQQELNRLHSMAYEFMKILPKQ